MSGFRSWPALSFLLVLAGCGLPTAETVSLTYAPTHSIPVTPPRNVVGVGPVVDARASPPDLIGTAADKFGWREEALASEPPLPRAVRAAFTDALMARGLLAAPGRARYELGVRVVRLDAQQAWRRHVVADLAVSLRRSGGGIVYRDAVAVLGRARGPFSVGTIAYVPIAGIAELTQGSLSRAIDAALDNPRFRAALRH